MEIKQVLVVRKDLKMRRGKEIAQGSHSSLAFIGKKLKQAALSKLTGLFVKWFDIYIIKLSESETKWFSSSYKKVAVQVASEAELIEIHERALAAGLESNLITDSGLTEFGGVKTKTCVAIGPDLDKKIDKITGHLKLY